MADYTFHALDQQLANLLQRLSPEVVDETVMSHLQRLVRYVSERTRDGVIAAPLANLPFTPADWQALQALPVIGNEHDYKPIIVSDTHAWLYRYWQYEERLVQWLVHRLQRSDTVNPPVGLADIEDLQQQAVLKALQAHFFIIAGGPGTGKTTTVTRLLAALVQQDTQKSQRILLAAPTGKAAMRMQEAIRYTKQRLQLDAATADLIPEQAQTLHRLLGFIPNRIGFHYGKEHPLPADVVIVDEASMIDISLMTHLFEAVPEHAKLILLGDKDQLTSVETGSIFRDLCSGTALTAHMQLLQTSHRFAANDGIGLLAQAIRQADASRLLALLQDEQQPAITLRESPDDLSAQAIREGWQAYIQAVIANDKALIFGAFNALRILTPLRKGRLGVEGLNPWVDGIMQRVMPMSQPYSRPWYIGRPVMVTQNDYRQNLFNGDIGIALPDANGELRVWFPETDGASGQAYRAIAPIRLPAHETAWAMTIHKSQGSEFERVLLVLPDAENLALLGRELLYTAVTRAKKSLVIMAKPATLLQALRHVTPPSSQVQEKLQLRRATLSNQ